MSMYSWLGHPPGHDVHVKLLDHPHGHDVHVQLLGHPPGHNVHVKLLDHSPGHNVHVKVVSEDRVLSVCHSALPPGGQLGQDGGPHVPVVGRV